MEAHTNETNNSSADAAHKQRLQALLRVARYTSLAELNFLHQEHIMKEPLVRMANVYICKRRAQNGVEVLQDQQEKGKTGNARSHTKAIACYEINFVSKQIGETANG